MKAKFLAACLIIALTGSPASAQVCVSLPIPSIPIAIKIPFLGGGRCQASSSSCPNVDPREQQFVQYWNAAVDADHAKNYQLAINLYQRALTIHPENKEVRLYLGQAYRQAGMTDAAIAVANELLQVNAGEEKVWRLLMNAYIDSNQLDLALETGNAMLLHFPSSKNRKRTQLDVQNIQREISKRMDAPQELATGYDSYLPYACAQGVHRWPLEKMPLKVFIASGRGLPKWKDELVPAVRDAFNQWMIASAGMVRFVEVSDQLSADILVTWDDGKKDLGHSGHAGPDDSENGWIRHANIVLHTQLPHMRSEVTAQSIYQTAQHEIGHALGLMGHSDQPSDVMYWSGTPVGHSITARDVRTLMYLYGVNNTQQQAYAPQQQAAGYAYNPYYGQ